MAQHRSRRRLSRLIASTGLLGAAALHAAWAAGSSWPAHNRRDLADAVVGSPDFPSAEATAVVAGVTGLGALVVAGAGGDRKRAVCVRRGIGLALLARAIADGEVACRVLGLPEPSNRFRELDTQIYRPACALIGLTALRSARKKTSE